MLAEAKQHKRAATAFLRLSSLLTNLETNEVPVHVYGTGAIPCRGLPNFANRPYITYKAARCLFALEKHDRAFHLLKSIPFRKRTVAVHYDLGREFLRRGLKPQALASFREVLRANPYAVELVRPLLELGCSAHQLLEWTSPSHGLPSVHSSWLQSIVAMEQAAVAADNYKAVRAAASCMLPTASMPCTPSEDAAMEFPRSLAGIVDLLPVAVLSSSVGLHCSSDGSGEVLEEADPGVALSLSQGSCKGTAQTWLLNPSLPLATRDSDDHAAVPIFPHGHPMLLSRMLELVSDFDMVSEALSLYKRLRVADPLGIPGSDQFAYALARAVHKASIHGGGGELKAEILRELSQLVAVLASDRHHASAWAVAALLSWSQGDTHNAVRFVNTGMQCDSYQELCMTVKGHVLHDMKSYHSAANHFFTSNTRRPSLHCVQGVVDSYAQLGMWRQALAHAASATKASPHDARAPLLLGNTILQALLAGDSVEEEIMQERYGIDFSFSGAARQVCLCCEDLFLAQHKTAFCTLCYLVSQFSAALSKCPGLPEAIVGLAFAEYEGGNKGAAEQRYVGSPMHVPRPGLVPPSQRYTFFTPRACRRLQDADVPAHAMDYISFHRARFLLREERYQDAVKLLQVLVGTTVDFPGAQKLLRRAEALMRGEDPDAAEADDAREVEGEAGH